jgi:predicted lipoprotein with Yx(FWY)xxD motif
MDELMTISVRWRGARALLAGGALTLTAGSVLAACSSGHQVASPSGAAASKPAGRAVEVQLETLPGHGSVLTTKDGFALYTYTADPDGASACSGDCLRIWPALLLPPGTSQPVGGPGVTGLGVINRPEGMQVTFDQRPLYTYDKDTQPGQVTGTGVVDSLGTWELAVPGSPLTTLAHPATSAPPATMAPAPPATVHRPPVTQPSPSAPSTAPITAPAGGVSY